ncbi:metaxin-1-like isoform X2 [Ornithodoros turicata]|uniref:metaxin-1-like isoform X2 n=1 Tax=Ornithodoros turicata TaxID=34597 RepID=UPI003138B2BE
MELNIWKGDWGLPSIDSSCLEVLAYAKFSGAPLKVYEIRRPWFGRLPSLRHGPATRLTRFEDILSYLRKQNYSADIQLTAQQVSDVKAYSAMLSQKLKPALLYLWWIDGKNYTQLTRPWYARALAFPLNYILPGQMQRAATDAVHSKLDQLDFDDTHAVESAVFKEAQECLTTLSQRLGKGPFFFGKRPTSLDAIVFGHLAPLLKAPFPSSALQHHLKACDNLAAFVGRILQQYFPPAKLGEGDEKYKPSSDSPDDDAKLTWTNLFLSVGFATVAMVGYAIMSGLVQFVPFSD